MKRGNARGAKGVGHRCERGPTGSNREARKLQQKAAAFARWHERDDARVSSPVLERLGVKHFGPTLESRPIDQGSAVSALPPFATKSARDLNAAVGHERTHALHKYREKEQHPHRWHSRAWWWILRTWRASDGSVTLSALSRNEAGGRRESTFRGNHYDVGALV